MTVGLGAVRNRAFHLVSFGFRFSLRIETPYLDRQHQSPLGG
jgi:hypothetical protein